VKRVVTQSSKEVIAQNMNFHKGCGELCNKDKECQAFEVIYSKKGDEEPTDCKLYLGPILDTPYTVSAKAGKCATYLSEGIVTEAKEINAESTKTDITDCVLACSNESTCAGYSWLEASKKCITHKSASPLIGNAADLTWKCYMK
jgi:hypothetical protein